MRRPPVEGGSSAFTLPTHTPLRPEGDEREREREKSSPASIPSSPSKMILKPFFKRLRCCSICSHVDGRAWWVIVKSALPSPRHRLTSKHGRAKKKRTQTHLPQTIPHNKLPPDPNLQHFHPSPPTIEVKSSSMTLMIPDRSLSLEIHQKNLHPQREEEGVLTEGEGSVRVCVF